MEIFTCSIFPHLTRIWYDYTRKVLGKDISITIYDCSGALQNSWIKGATVQKFKNIEHGLKIDAFLKKSNSNLVLVTDDDAFIRDAKLVGKIQEKMEMNKNLAIYSCHERDHWSYQLDNKKIWPIGTYTFTVNKEILLNEKISLRSVQTTENWVNSGKGYWDTANYTQYLLLQKGYDIESIPLAIDSPVSTMFGTSSGFVTWFKKSFFNSSFKLKNTFDRYKEELPNNKYLFERTLGVVAILDLYKDVYNEEPVVFPISYAELLVIGNHFIENDERILQRINDSIKLLSNTLLSKQ